MAQAAPTNALSTSNKTCGTWYTVSPLPIWYFGLSVLKSRQVVSGDTCAVVSIANLISLDDFYFLNPEINKDCTNLDLGVAYCVQPVGTITTYSGYTYTSSALITVPAATFPSVNTAITIPGNNPGYVATSPLSVAAPSATDKIMSSYCLDINGTAPETIPTCDCYTVVMGYNVGGK